MSKSASRSQLSLPAITTEHPSTEIERLLANVIEAPTAAARVHLRCLGCDWRQMLRVPRRRSRNERIERLLPRVPVRHWVFSLGESAQPWLVDQPRVRTQVARACVSAVFAWLRRAAARAGIIAPVRCGAVSTIHRVGATLESNVHVHALVLDGVYTHDANGTPVFHPMAAPRRRDLRRTLAELRHAIESILATTSRSTSRSTSRTQRRTHIAHHMEAGPVVRPVSPEPNAMVGRCGELDVRAGPPIDGDDQVVRARLCRYVARAPFDPGALSPGQPGRLRYRLHRPFSDGTTHVELSTHALAERLGVIAAGDWHPPVGFHGVVAPAAVTPRVRNQQLALLGDPGRPVPAASSAPLRCPRCQGPLDIIGVEWPERAA